MTPDNSKSWVIQGSFCITVTPPQKAPADERITEAGDVRVTHSGDVRIVQPNNTNN